MRELKLELNQMVNVGGEGGFENPDKVHDGKKE
jgi:hypothetical protein